MSQIKHVAIIMDGNGRWAKKRYHPRIWGHVRGSAVVSDIVREANSLNLSALTLYAFSTENWARPVEEVSTLFKLLKKFLIKEKNEIISNNIRFKVIGEIDTLPVETVSLIRDIENLTRNATGLKLTFAFNYGGRSEILKAVNYCHAKFPDREISESDLNSFMYSPETGDVDLMIRTGGEQRISNFLIWQLAYAELYFSNTKWPDFTPKEFRMIIDQVSSRERRFGNICKEENLDHSLGKAQFNKFSYLDKVGF